MTWIVLTVSVLLAFALGVRVGRWTERPTVHPPLPPLPETEPESAEAGWANRARWLH